MAPPLKNPAELALRLDLAAGERLLLVDLPDALRALAETVREGRGETSAAEGDRIRKVKETFDGVLLWREDRTGSQALLEAVAKRIEPGGFAWVIVALRKVTGIRTPGAHRLGREDLARVFSPPDWTYDRETRISAWHEGHRFVKKPAPRP